MVQMGQLTNINLCISKNQKQDFQDVNYGTHECIGVHAWRCQLQVCSCSKILRAHLRAPAKMATLLKSGVMFMLQDVNFLRALLTCAARCQLFLDCFCGRTQISTSLERVPVHGMHKAH
jgi:hypothetical protein